MLHVFDELYYILCLAIIAILSDPQDMIQKILCIADMAISYLINRTWYYV